MENGMNRFVSNLEASSGLDISVYWLEYGPCILFFFLPFFSVFMPKHLLPLAVSPSFSIHLCQGVPDVWPVLISWEEKSAQGHVLLKQSGPLQGQPPPSTVAFWCTSSLLCPMDCTNERA